MNKPSKAVSEYLAKIGKKGGSVSSEKKRIAAKANRAKRKPKALSSIQRQVEEL